MQHIFKHAATFLHYHIFGDVNHLKWFLEHIKQTCQSDDDGVDAVSSLRFTPKNSRVSFINNVIEAGRFIFAGPGQGQSCFICVDVFVWWSTFQCLPADHSSDWRTPTLTGRTGICWENSMFHRWKKNISVRAFFSFLFCNLHFLI